MCHLKTVTTARLRSKPRNEGQEYLDLWSLKLNRARWAQAQEQAQERLKAIDHAISKLEFPDGGMSTRRLTSASDALRDDSPTPYGETSQTLCLRKERLHGLGLAEASGEEP